MDREGATTATQPVYPENTIGSSIGENSVRIPGDATSVMPETSVSESNTPEKTTSEEKEQSDEAIAAEKRMKKAEFLGKGPLVKTMWSLTYPDLVAQMVGAVYNLADSIFVGQFSGSSVEEGKRALAGLSISAPIEQCLLVGMSLIFAQGGGPLYGRFLGKKDEKTASRIIGNTLVMDVLLGIVMAVVLPLLCDPLLVLLGASEEAGTLTPARTYIMPLIYGDVLYNFCFATNNLMRGEGAALFSCTLMIISSLTNVVMDFFLLKVFSVGISGAAYATLIAYTLAVSFGLWFFFSKRGAVSVKLSDFKLDWKLVGNIVNVGLPGMVIGLANGLLAVVCNQLILHFTKFPRESAETTAAIAASGSLVRMQFFLFIPVKSIANGAVALLSFCRGAGLNKRFMNGLKVCLVGQFAVCLVLAVLCFVFAEQLAALFNSDPLFVSIFSRGLRYMASTLWLCPISCTLYPGLQVIGRGFASAFVLLTRSLLSIVIVQFVMCSMKQDYWGVFLAYPFAEVLAALIAGIVFLFTKKDLMGEKLPIKK